MRKKYVVHVELEKERQEEKRKEKEENLLVLQTDIEKIENREKIILLYSTHFTLPHYQVYIIVHYTRVPHVPLSQSELENKDFFIYYYCSFKILHLTSSLMV